MQPMQKAKIVVFSIVAVVAYGIIHDQITVRLCLEYFTVAHPPLFPTRSPTLLAICWGTVATVWAGMAAGSLARARFPIRQRRRPFRSPGCTGES